MTSPELFERRGSDICISLEYDYAQSRATPTWVNYARWIATKRYVKVGRHIPPALGRVRSRHAGRLDQRYNRGYREEDNRCILSFMERPYARKAGLGLLCLAALVPPLIGGPLVAVAALVVAMLGAVLWRNLPLF